MIYYINYIQTTWTADTRLARVNILIKVASADFGEFLCKLHISLVKPDPKHAVHEGLGRSVCPVVLVEFNYSIGLYK